MASIVQLQQIAEDLKQGKNSPKPTVRVFLSWFNAQRRGIWVVETIRQELKRARLETEPDFESAYIDSEISFRIVGNGKPGSKADQKKPILPEQNPPEMATEAATKLPAYADPTYRVSKLEAANRPPVTVGTESELSEAITQMLSNGFSQLPVMMTNDRDVKGIISWESIGARLALGRPGGKVRDFMDQHHEIRADASLFSAIGIIVDHHYVLVRTPDNRISGIVTASDLSLQFRRLSEPFLLLSEIENHIRRVIAAKFSDAELTEVRDPSDDQKISGVSDLNFGEYVRLLENGDRWAKIDLAIDRKTFCAKLDAVRKIRNDVMHFDPDGITDAELNVLRDFSRFLFHLQTLEKT